VGIITRIPPPEVGRGDGDIVIRVDCMTRSEDVVLVTYASDLVSKITCQVGETGLIYRRWLRTPC